MTGGWDSPSGVWVLSVPTLKSLPKTLGEPRLPRHTSPVWTPSRRVVTSHRSGPPVFAPDTRESQYGTRDLLGAPSRGVRGSNRDENVGESILGGLRSPVLRCGQGPLPRTVEGSRPLVWAGVRGGSYPSNPTHRDWSCTGVCPVTTTRSGGVGGTPWGATGSHVSNLPTRSVRPRGVTHRVDPETGDSGTVPGDRHKSRFLATADHPGQVDWAPLPPKPECEAPLSGQE